MSSSTPTTDIQINGIIMPPHKDVHTFAPSLKQKLLLFDRIGVPLLKASIYSHVSVGKQDLVQGMIDLRKENLIFDASNDEATNIYEMLENLPKGSADIIAVIKEIQDQPELFKEYKDFLKLAHDKVEDDDEHLQLFARLSAMIWNGMFYKREQHREFIPLVPIINIPGLDKPKSQVYNVVFKNVPIPHPDTPIHHILEFKSNEDNKGRLLQFRSLVNKLSKSGYNEKEIQQEIDNLMHQYQQAMNKHDIKWVNGVLDVATGLIIEPIGKLLSSVLKLRSSSVNLSSAELAYPGRDISYVYNSQKMFGKQ